MADRKFKYHGSAVTIIEGCYRSEDHSFGDRRANGSCRDDETAGYMARVQSHPPFGPGVSLFPFDSEDAAVKAAKRKVDGK